MNNQEKLERYKKERLGLSFKTKNGESYTIIKYENNKNILIQFNNGYIKQTSWINIKRDNVNSPFLKTLSNVGYIGVGNYDSSKNPEAYLHWNHMIRRCYDAYTINRDKNLTYIDCFVCEEWHCFQNFAEWYEENYYEVEGETMCLDKDILCKSNKIYSPETCVFVPQRINSLFVKADKMRGDYPVGVHYHTKHNWLEVNCCIYKDKKKKQKYLGKFPLNKPFQAFYTYKQFKEQYIKQIADEYKDLIPTKLYEAMYKYEVEIND